MVAACACVHNISILSANIRWAWTGTSTSGCVKFKRGERTGSICFGQGFFRPRRVSGGLACAKGVRVPRGCHGVCQGLTKFQGSLRCVFSYRFGAANTAPHRRIFASWKTTPHRTVRFLPPGKPHRTAPYVLRSRKTAPNRTVAFPMFENRTEPHRRVCHKTAPHRRIHNIYKRAYRPSFFVILSTREGIGAAKITGAWRQGCARLQQQQQPQAVAAPATALAVALA